MKIMCATDGSKLSEKAVAHAADLAKRLGAQLSIVAVNIRPLNPRSGASSMWSDSEVEKLLRDAAAKAKRAGAGDVRTAAISGPDAADTIVGFAEEEGIDHIVTGSGGKRGVARLVVGSVAANVVAKAHCAVTVAR